MCFIQNKMPCDPLRSQMFLPAWCLIPVLHKVCLSPRAGEAALSQIPVSGAHLDT